MPLLHSVHVIMLLGLLFLSIPGAHAVPILLDPRPATEAAARPMEKTLVLAYEALGRDDLDTAEIRFQEASDIDPKSAVPYIGLAEVALRHDLPSMAESLLKKAMAIDPGNRAGYRAWGRFLFMQQKFTEAESAFKQALSLDPDDPGVLIELGENYLNGLNQPSEAEDAYRKAISLNAKLPGAHMGLAAALAVQGQIPQAADEYTLAAEYEPASPLPLHMLGRLYASQRRFTESLAALDRALLINPAYLPGWLERGDVHVANNEPDLALTDYQAAADLAPKLALAHFKMGAVYHAQEQWQKAETAYRKAIDLDPNQFDAYNNLAWMSADRRQGLDDGLRWIEKAIEIAPESANLYDTLGWVRRARGEGDLAIAAFERAVALNTPPLPDALYHLGLAYADAGRNSDAVAVLRQALESGVDFPEAENARRQLRELEAR